MQHVYVTYVCTYILKDNLYMEKQNCNNITSRIETSTDNTVPSFAIHV